MTTKQLDLFKTTHKTDVPTSILYTDRRIVVRLNPRYIRTRTQLDRVLAHLRRDMEHEVDYAAYHSSVARKENYG